MIRRAKPFGSGGPLVYLLALVVVIITLGPVVYGALGGFRSNEQLARDPSALPDPWVYSNYSAVLTDEAFWRYALNSTIVAGVTTLVAVLFGVMAAYPLARYQFKGRESLYTVFVLGLLFPAAVAIIPLFILVVARPAAGQHLVGGGVAAGCVRAADHGGHPAPVPDGDPP